MTNKLKIDAISGHGTQGSNPQNEDRRVLNFRGSLPPPSMEFVIVGESGSGKTSLACTFPKPLLLEFGSNEDRGSPRAMFEAQASINHTYWPDVDRTINDLRDGRFKDFQTVVIDAIGELQELLESHLDKYDFKFEAWGRLRTIKALSNALREAARAQGMNVVTLVHYEAKSALNSKGAPTTKLDWSIFGSTRAALRNSALQVGFIRRNPDGTRFLTFDSSEELGIEAKNTYNLKPVELNSNQLHLGTRIVQLCLERSKQRREDNNFLYKDEPSLQADSLPPSVVKQPPPPPPPPPKPKPKPKPKPSQPPAQQPPQNGDNSQAKVAIVGKPPNLPSNGAWIAFEVQHAQGVTRDFPRIKDVFATLETLKDQKLDLDLLNQLWALLKRRLLELSKSEEGREQNYCEDDDRTTRGFFYFKAFRLGAYLPGDAASSFLPLPPAQPKSHQEQNLELQE